MANDVSAQSPREDRAGTGSVDPREAAVDAALAASKALVGVAARSLAVLDGELTLGQYRGLLLVVEGRVAGPGDLAELLEVHPSNAGRLVDRLVAKGLVERSVDESDRRQLAIVATPEGRATVERVLSDRRVVLDEILAGLPIDEVDEVARALSRFAEVAGEAAHLPAVDAWQLGWGS
jgi:DNA-binding MarR family transcriptional regulator